MSLTSSLLGDTGDVQVVNTLNKGTLPFLPDDAVIEVPAAVGAGGATPLPVAPLEPLYAGLTSHVTAYEHLALEAALLGADAGEKAGRRAVVRGAARAPVDRPDRVRGPAHGRAHRTQPGAAGVGLTGSVLAIDAGNSKTDVALLGTDGSVLGSACGGGFQPPMVGTERAIAGLAGIVARVAADAGLGQAPGALAEHVSACLANCDVPIEEERFTEAIAARGWGRTVTVTNDTFALLRSGLPDGVSRPSCAARASTARGWPPAGAPRASPRSAGSPATGAAAATWRTRPCGGRRGRGTGGGSGRRSPTRCPRTSASPTCWS